MIDAPFFKSSVELDLNFALYQACPRFLGEHLAESAKRYARFLGATFPAISHRTLLEHIAKAAGFDDWHTFGQLTKALGFDPANREVAIKAKPSEATMCQAIPAFPLLVKISEVKAPTEKQQASLVSFAGKLAKVLSSEKETILDLMARLFAADSWADLCRRSPIAWAGPLYTFRVDGESGEFVWSDAASELVAQLDDQFQRFDELGKTQQLVVKQFVVQTTQQRPDFLEAWLALATILESEGDMAQAGAIYAKTIEQAESFMPADFKGEVSWYGGANRFYHRLLYAHMRWHMAYLNGAEALALAKKQLKLNPSDNLGVRYTQAVLLAANSTRVKTEQACKKLTKVSRDYFRTPNDWFIAAICRLAIGETEAGKADLLRALFHLPGLRPFLANTDFNGSDNQWHRGIIPDYNAMALDADYLFAALPQMRLLGEVKSICLARVVRAAEDELSASYQLAKLAIQSDKGAAWNAWQFSVEAMAVDLAKRV